MSNNFALFLLLLPPLLLVWQCFELWVQLKKLAKAHDRIKQLEAADRLDALRANSAHGNYDALARALSDTTMALDEAQAALAGIRLAIKGK